MARKLLLIIIVLTLTPFLWSQKMIPAMTFNNIPISDILLALADAVEVTIIPDETVHGQASFHFANISFEEGLESFLDPHNMYFRKEGGIYYVSRIQVTQNPDNTINVDAEDVLVRFIIDQISETIAKAILYDQLPTMSPTIHVMNLAPKRVLEILIRQAQGYELLDEGDYYYIKQDPETVKPDPITDRILPFDNLRKNPNGTYSINKSRVQFKDLVQELFAEENAEYQMLYNRAQQINEPLIFNNKNFHQMLNLICEKGNADYVIRDGIYYIFEVQERDIVKKFKINKIISLKYITAQDLQRIMPSDIGAGSSKFYRMDLTNNTVILNGSMDEIDPLVEFIAEVDKEDLDNIYYRYDLNFIDAKKISSLLPDSFKFIKTTILDETNSFVMQLTKEKKKMLDEYIALLDRPAGSFEVRLKYIKAEDLVKLLPPSVAKDDIVQTLDPTLIFFRGNKEKLAAFNKQLAVFDQPVPQIRYQIFVISHNEGKGMDWQQSDNPVYNFSLKDPANRAPGEDVVAIAGALGGLFSLNFDVVTNLGLAGAYNLNWSMNNNSARIITDTMLHGLSGEKVAFNDVETYFTTTTEIDPETGEKTEGTKASADTGFKLKIEGWTSGDGMITMDVTVSITSKGTGDLLTGSGTTYNKEITEKVRTMSGVPLEISGLMRQNNTTSVQKIPFLGDIPIIGEILFARKTESMNKSKLSVFILPQIDKSPVELADSERRIKDLYLKFIKN